MLGDIHLAHGGVWVCGNLLISTDCHAEFGEKVSSERIAAAEQERAAVKCNFAAHVEVLHPVVVIILGGGLWHSMAT
jgi:metallophosphoesterase superfamily enzyme